MTQLRHPHSKLLYEFCVGAATGGQVTVICDNCKQRQPNAHAVARDVDLVGCFRCNHPTGTYA